MLELLEEQSAIACWELLACYSMSDTEGNLSWLVLRAQVVALLPSSVQLPIPINSCLINADESTGAAAFH